jgi:hypothetical protein
MKIEITEKEKEELLRALRSHQIKLAAMIEIFRSSITKEDFKRRKEVADNLIKKIYKQA